MIPFDLVGSTVTLSYPVRYLHELISNGDWLGLVFVAVVVGYVGKAMVQHRPNIRPWGGRIALIAFIVFAAKRALQYGEPGTEDLVAAVLHGLLAGAIILGPAWIVLAGVGFCNDRWSEMQQAARRRSDQRRREREVRQRQRELARQESERERLAPERELATREAAERQRVVEQQRQIESHRREDARVACDLLYALREPDIGDRYSRQRFEEFVSTYLGDSKPIDVFERRAAELQQLIQQHYQAVNPPEKFRNLAELTTWYEEQLTLVENLSIADVYKRDYRAQLNERYSELTDRLLESLEP